MLWLPDDLERKGNVFEHRLVEEQFVVLKDISNVSAKLGNAVVRHVDNVATGNPDRALLRPLLTVDQTQQGAFP